MKRVIVLIVLLSVVGCSSKPEITVEAPLYNIAGNWEYTLTASDGNVYDNGTIEFTGTPNQGNWTLQNFYDIEYSGTYTVSGNTVSLVGDEVRQGSFVDDTHITGEWENEEANGEWTAVRK